MSSKGWVISLGAGREQLPLIKAIQAEGYKCLAFDINPEADGASLADDFHCVSNRDIAAMHSYIEDERSIAGVMAAGTEVPDAMAILAHRLNLPGIPEIGRASWRERV